MSDSSNSLVRDCQIDTREQDLRVIECDFHKDPRWEEFVDSQSDALVYHHPTWLDVLEREYGRKCVSLACVNAAGDIRAVLPLFYTRGCPFSLGSFLSARLTSLPRTPLGGPLAREPRAAALILREAKCRVEGEPDLQLELKVNELAMDDLETELSKVQWRESYSIRLPSDPEAIRFGSGGHHRRLKWTVKKAIKNGLICREAQNERDLRDWYPLYLQRMRQNAVPARPFRFFASLWELMRPKGLMRLIVVDRPDAGRRVMVAGSIFFMFHGTVSYAFSGSRTQDMWLSPNDLLHWQHIHRCCEEGFQIYDFGEVPNGHPELALFKSKWGAERIRLYRYYYPIAHTHETISAGGSLGKIAASVWRCLPLRVTAYVSDHVYSYL